MGLAAVVKEDLPGEPVGEVEAFRAAVWPDAAVYLDESRAFYSAVQGGAPVKSSLAGFLANVANPFSRLNQFLKRDVDYKGNLIGEGFVHGGLMLVDKGHASDAPAAFAHAEVALGEHASLDEFFTAARGLGAAGGAGGSVSDSASAAQ